MELRGFEPLTPSMRTRCATGLRYSPKTGSQRTKRRASPTSAYSAPPDVQPAAEVSIADCADGGVSVLVVKLVGDAAGDVDDLGAGGGMCGIVSIAFGLGA